MNAKSLIVSILLVCVLFGSMGCQSTVTGSHGADYGLAGAGVGGLAGALMNKNDPLKGGLIGAGIGGGAGLVGGLVQDHMEKQQAKKAAEEHAWRMANDTNYRLAQENQAKAARLNYDRSTVDLVNQQKSMEAEQARINAQLGR